MMLNNITTNQAHALTGDDILNKMNTDQRLHYIGGILAGLGYARFLRDNPDAEGFKCIEGWLNKDSTTRWDVAKQWLEHHKEKSAPVIISAMVNKDCGE